MDRVLPGVARHRMPGDKVHKLAGVLDADGVDDMYLRLTSHWRDPESLVLGSSEPRLPRISCAIRSSLSTNEWMMYRDLVSYLPDDILTKVDLASMGVSLEARLPLLDHRVVEFAWRLPLAMKIRDGKTKWILRQVLQRYIPSAWWSAPRWDSASRSIPGSGARYGRGPRSCSRRIASSARDSWNRRWSRGRRDHLSGNANRQYLLWDVLMFEAWWRSTAEVPHRSAVAAGPARARSRIGRGSSA